MFCCRSKVNRFFSSPISDAIKPLVSLEDNSNWKDFLRGQELKGSVQ